MRQIKFRVWDTKTKKFLEFVPPIEYMLDHDEWSRRDINDESSLLFPQNIAETFGGRLVWQQFTGLKDENEKEIYEGDIVEFCHEEKTKNLKVEFSEGYFGLNNGNIKLALLAAYYHKCKVIGNILENPNLLTKSNT
jgi:uncharacterized phage protein (TIGR01671 family)